MQVTPLDADLDGVAIIDGLSAAERLRYQDTTKLTNAIHNIEPDYVGPQFECANSRDYNDALTDLTTRARSGQSYFVHYECHGSPDGIKMGTDIIEWKDQVDFLVKLNQAMHGQLVVDLMACNGIYATTMTGLSTHPAPFYAIIGPAYRVGMNCASVISVAFYTAHLNSQSGRLDDAIQQANNVLGLQVINGIRSEAFAQLQSQGYPFRPNAKDNNVVDCKPDGTVYIS
jgi:hypothetical protein